MLLIHAKRFSIESLAPSRFPPNISPIKGTLTVEEKSDPVVALVCIEQEDGDSDVEEAVKLLLDHSKAVSAEEILIIPFSHLSSKLKEPPEVAYTFLSEIFKRISWSNALRTSLGDFGYHNRVFLETHWHPLSFVFREIVQGSQCCIERKNNKSHNG